MQRPNLVGVYTKMVRAYQHVDALKDAVQRFAMSRPHRPVIEQDPDPDWIRIRYTTLAAPPEFAVLSGDIVQCVRQALDHLAWQLVIDAGETPQASTVKGKRATQFPIFTEPPRESGTGNRTTAKVFPRISDETAAFIESIQPYTPRPDMQPFAPKDHHLAVIADLSNADKHRTLHVTMPHIANPYLFWEIEDERIDIGHLLGNAENGAELARLHKSSIPTKPNMKVGLTAIVKVAIEVPSGSIVPITRDEDRPGWMSIDTLPDMILGTTINPLVELMKRP